MPGDTVCERLNDFIRARLQWSPRFMPGDTTRIAQSTGPRERASMEPQVHAWGYVVGTIGPARVETASMEPQVHAWGYLVGVAVVGVIA